MKNINMTIYNIKHKEIENLSRIIIRTEAKVFFKELSQSNVPNSKVLQMSSQILKEQIILMYKMFEKQLLL